MTKSQLIEAVHKKDTGLTKVQVSQVVDAMIESITGALAKSDKVEIRGFGNFRVVRGRPGRRGIREPAKW